MRYGYGVIAVIVALGAALALRFFDLERFLFVIAVAVSVWFGGRGPRLLAVALSMMLDYSFLSPARGTWTILPTHVAYFVAPTCASSPRPIAISRRPSPPARSAATSTTASIAAMLATRFGSRPPPRRRRRGALH